MPQLLVFLGSDTNPNLQAATMRSHVAKLTHTVLDQSSQLPRVEEMWVNPQATPILIEQVRELMNQLSFGTAQLRIVYMLEFHLASQAAQQALLKTLEEPTNNTLFVLGTTQVDACLPTIRSRCIEQRIQLGTNQHDPSAEDIQLFDALQASNLGQAVQEAERWSDREAAIAFLTRRLHYVTNQNVSAFRPQQQAHLLTAINQLTSGVNVKLVMADLAIKLNQSVV